MVAATELLSHLPDSARLWAFGVGRLLSKDEEAGLISTVDGFLQEWAAHGHPLAASKEWLYDRFLLVGVDDRVTAPSGCSIDALVHALRRLEADLGTEIVGGGPVWYREGGPDGEIVKVDRSDFKRLAQAGVVTGDTTVFDLSVTRVGELREGRWETRARDSWHGRYLS